MTKKQRDAQEREYCAEMDALDDQQKRDDAQRNARDRSAIAENQRTRGGLFQDSYGDPVIHMPDYDE